LQVLDEGWVQRGGQEREEGAELFYEIRVEGGGKEWDERLDLFNECRIKGGADEWESVE
jgi:hypothetical protein